MQIQRISEKIRIICQNVLIVLLVHFAEFFRENTIFLEKYWVRYTADR